MDPVFLLVIIALVLLLLLTLGTVLFLLWKSGRTSLLLQGQLQEITSLAANAGERQESLTRVLAEGQVRNLETLQSQFASVVDTLNRQLAAVSTTLNQQLAQTSGNIGQQLDGTRKVVADVQERLGELTETARHMHALGKDISSLQDILQAPKLRGNLGELFLEDLLSQMLPSSSYSMQHTFATGEKVDAVIRLGAHLVPIDSKFPLESFKRMQSAETDEDGRKARREFTASVRQRIDEIAGKYIRPDENTFDFAIMYIPAENVFYEVIIRDEDSAPGRDLSTYALQRHVIPASPNSFYAYLMALAYGLKGLRIEESAVEIRAKLAEIRQGFRKFSDEYAVIGRHLDNARGKYSDADKSLARLRETFRLATSEEETADGPKA
jgi:DNA recombination protein RmuC